MAALTPTNTPVRHIVGDLAWRDYSLSGTDGDTFTAATTNIAQVIATPTTNISLGASWVNGVITFHASGAWAARVSVIERTG